MKCTRFIPAAIALAFSTQALFAETAKPTPKPIKPATAAALAAHPMTDKEKAARLRARMERRAKRITEKGGFVSEAPKGKIFRVFSAQSYAKQEDLAESMRVLVDAINIPIEWKDVETQEKVPGKICHLGNADGKCGAGVVLVEDPDQPSLLIAPENGWSMINIAALKADNPKRTTFVRRLKQEFWRATCMLLGAYESNSKPCLLTLAASNSDLDRNVCVIPSIEVLPKAKSAARRMGILAARRVLYEQACREGWAPAPTNDVQRAVMAAVKAEQSKDPEKAIKIKYDPKKGK